MDITVANQVYDVLVSICGANEHDRESFLYHQTSDTPPTEWRFCGALGFGGKFWRAGESYKPWYVNCYREDRTSKREKIIDAANEALARLWS